MLPLRAIVRDEVREEVLGLHRGRAGHPQERDFEECRHQLHAAGFTIGGDAAPHEVVHGPAAVPRSHIEVRDFDCLLGDLVVLGKHRDKRPLFIAPLMLLSKSLEFCLRLCKRSLFLQLPVSLR